MNPRTLFHHLDIVSVSHHTETSCWFIGLGFLSSTLVKLLNLFVHPYLVKQKKKKNQLTKNPKLLIGWHFRPRPCGNNDKPEERWIKASNQQDRFQTSELFLICVMSSVWMWMTAKAELSFDIPKRTWRYLTVGWFCLKLWHNYQWPTQELTFATKPWYLILQSHCWLTHIVKAMNYSPGVLQQSKRCTELFKDDANLYHKRRCTFSVFNP